LSFPRKRESSGRQLSSPRQRGSSSRQLSSPRQRGSRKVCMLERRYYVYILASQKNGTLYIGLTNNLVKRIYQHKNNLIAGFTKKYNVHQLVYYEEYDNINIAISREKQMKKWERKWKLELIEKDNLLWRDLYKELNPIY